MNDDDHSIAPNTLDRCIESLAFCHTQDETRGPAARVVAQQDIDEFMRDAGPDLANQYQALALLMAAFDRMFPHPADPILIRSYARRQMRRIGLELQNIGRHTQDAASIVEVAAPGTAPAELDGEAEGKSEPEVADTRGSR